MRTQYDGVNADAAAIHAKFPDTGMVAYYIDGEFTWTAAEIALFPDAEHVTITVLAGKADVADCENGNLTPEQAAQWVRDRRAEGYFRPTVYCSLSTVEAVREATGDLVLGVDYDLWVAEYNGTADSAYPGSVAHQYLNTPGYDTSAVYDDGWPHRTPPAPAAPVKATADTWPAGVILREGSTGGAVHVLQQALCDSGITGVRGITVDGVFGSQTLTSVRNLEAAKRLTVDGIAGPEVRAALGIS